MIQRLFTFICIVLLPVLSSEYGTAQQVQSFHCAGSGFFEPANIGSPRGGNFGLVLGDGSGQSAYTATGADFTIGGAMVGSGLNDHVGGNRSWSTGILFKGGSTVKWPAKSNQTHVLTSDDGEVHFEYRGDYTLDLATNQFGATALFRIVGGTERFANARGIVLVDVIVTGAPVEPIPFDYDFNGFIVLGE